MAAAGSAAPQPAHEEPDLIAVEEPLEIRVGDAPLVVTMRTPGDDLDLVAGFLLSEGVIASLDDLATLEHVDEATAGAEAGNVVRVTPAAGRALALDGARRAMRATAACGLCGKETIAAVRRRTASLRSDGTRVPLSVLLSLPAALRSAQEVFAATGGLHAVGLFRPDGQLLAVREDIGRHNAVDKVIGHALRAGAGAAGPAPLAGLVMMFSGRAGFEVVQKAAVAGVPVVCAVSAPSSLAVDLAREVGITLAGFVRGGAANLYAHPDRIT